MKLKANALKCHCYGDKTISPELCSFQQETLLESDKIVLSGIKRVKKKKNFPHQTEKQNKKQNK